MSGWKDRILGSALFIVLVVAIGAGTGVALVGQQQGGEFTLQDQNWLAYNFPYGRYIPDRQHALFGRLTSLPWLIHGLDPIAVETFYVPALVFGAAELGGVPGRGVLFYGDGGFAAALTAQTDSDVIFDGLDAANQLRVTRFAGDVNGDGWVDLVFSDVYYGSDDGRVEVRY